VRRVTLRAVVLIAFGVLAYSNSLGSPLVLGRSAHDSRQHVDPGVVAARPRAVSGARAAGVRPPRRQRLVRAQLRARRENVAGYRVGNILIHVLCGLVLCGVVRRACELPHFATGSRAVPATSGWRRR
jgi:hypothetical protein